MLEQNTHGNAKPAEMIREYIACVCVCECTCAIQRFSDSTDSLINATVHHPKHKQTQKGQRNAHNAYVKQVVNVLLLNAARSLKNVPFPMCAPTLVIQRPIFDCCTLYISISPFH